MINKIRTLVRSNLLTRKLFGYYLASSGLFDSYFKNYKLSNQWAQRIATVLESPDNLHIPKHRQAGEIIKGKQIMHNGIKINLGSYYGPEYARMLLENKGIHEPQEERVFMEVLKTLPPKSTMIEMGAFWSFYSMWFQKSITSARNFMIEPDKFNLGQGKRNFKLNNMRGTFVQAFVGNCSNEFSNPSTICIDNFVLENNIDYIHILHSDIQGAELEMLKGSRSTIESNRIGYIFISTHSDAIHNECLDFLRQYNFHIVAEANMEETYSEDGLIVARSQSHTGLNEIKISKRILNTK